MYDLKITIDHQSGYCFGVIYAIEMAEEILDEQGFLYCLGDIVHNDEEVRRLNKKGLIIIDHDQLNALKDATVLIRAHGEPPSTYKIAMQNNIRLIDASCPVVLKLQERIRRDFESGKEIWIYGKENHPEVIGLKGQTRNQALVFTDGDEIPEVNGHPVAIYSQTTKSRSNFYRIASGIKGEKEHVAIHDTVCRQVSNRDEELREFSGNYDRIVFVAGKKSSNGKVLYEVCRETNPQTYFISSSGELNRDWFNPGETVGICGATSTPQWLMEEVRAVLSRW